MSIAIESVVSTRRTTKEAVRAPSLVPGLLQDKAATLIQLLKDYYSYMNEQGAPTNEISGIDESRNIDVADYAYLDKIQKEIAITVPKYAVVDRVTLYKNLMRYYSIRGSQESISLFFKIMFNDEVEVYYPQTDVLIPSSGSWVPPTSGIPGRYNDNKGFLSNTIKLQDSYYWQQFSYVIRTANNLSTWGDAFNRLVHPGGFIFFGEILIYIKAVNIFGPTFSILEKDDARIPSSMRHFQPGLANDDKPLILIISPLGGTDNTFKKTYYDTVDTTATASIAEIWKEVSIDIPSGTATSTMIKFVDPLSMSIYRDLTIEDAVDSMYIWDDFTVEDLINTDIVRQGFHLRANLL